MMRHLPLVRLTDREIQMLTFASLGMSAKEIARALVIAPRTVDKHFESLKTKTGARNRTHLMVYAYRWGYLDLPPA